MPMHLQVAVAALTSTVAPGVVVFVEGEAEAAQVAALARVSIVVVELAGSTMARGLMDRWVLVGFLISCEATWAA